MHAKLLVIVWALATTYILWAPMEGDGSREQSGIFDYSETEVIEYRPRPEPDPAFRNTPCGSLSMMPIPETRVRYKTPQLAATIVTTGLVWFLIGAAWWRRG